MLVSSLPVAVAGLCGIWRSADMEPTSTNVRFLRLADIAGAVPRALVRGLTKKEVADVLVHAATKLFKRPLV